MEEHKKKKKIATKHDEMEIKTTQEKRKEGILCMNIFFPTGFCIFAWCFAC